MNQIRAKEMMNPEVMTVRDDMTVFELASFFTEMEISGAPVVDADNRLLGVVSITDIVHRAAEGVDVARTEKNPNFYHGWEGQLSMEDMNRLHLQQEGDLVRDIMNPTVYSVTEDTPVSEIAETMVNSRIHRVLVMRNEKLLGIITSLDLLKLLRNSRAS